MLNRKTFSRFPSSILGRLLTLNVFVATLYDFCFVKRGRLQRVILRCKYSYYCYQ